MLAVTINTVVDGALVVLLEYLDMKDVLAHEYLVCHLGDLELSILIEDDDVVEVGAVAYELVLLQACSHETFLSVDVELLVGFHHLGYLDGVEVANLGLARMQLAIFALEILKPVDGDIGHVGEVVLYLGKLCLDLHQQLVCLILIIFKDALHLDFEQLEDVFTGDLTMEGIFRHALAIHLGGEELVLEWLQLGVDEGYHLVLGLALLKLALLVDAFLDEDALQGGEEELFLQFALANHQLFAEQSHGTIYTVAEHIADGEELRLVVLDDAAVGRDVDFAITEGIEGIHRLVGGSAWSEVYENLHVGGGDILYLASLDLAFLHRLGDALDEASRGLAEWYLGDDERLVVELVYLGTNLQNTATLTIVVLAHIDGTASREVGIDGERLSF